MKKLASFIISLFPLILSAQTIADKASDSLRNSGKLYAVISVLMTIFIGIIIFLIILEKRVRNLEK